MKMAGRMRFGLVLTVLLGMVGFGVWCYRQLLRPASLPPKPRTIEEVIRVLGPHVDRRLRPAFRQAEVAMPPEQAHSACPQGREAAGDLCRKRLQSTQVCSFVPDSRGERNSRS